MVKLLGFLCAALLFASAPARAAAGCDPTDQRPNAQSPQKDDKSQSNKPSSGREGRKKFWIDPELRAELAITDQQSKDLEQVWQRTFSQRRELNDRLDKADAILQKMLRDFTVDEAALIAQLDKVEAARGEANKARVLVLYRMNKLLTPDQRAKLDAKVKAMHERDGRRGGGPRPR